MGLQAHQRLSFALESLVVLRLQRDLENTLARLPCAFAADLKGQTGAAFADYTS